MGSEGIENVKQEQSTEDEHQRRLWRDLLVHAEHSPKTSKELQDLRLKYPCVEVRTKLLEALQAKYESAEVHHALAAADSKKTLRPPWKGRCKVEESSCDFEADESRDDICDSEAEGQLACEDTHPACGDMQPERSRKVGTTPRGSKAHESIPVATRCKLVENAGYRFVGIGIHKSELEVSMFYCRDGSFKTQPMHWGNECPAHQLSGHNAENWTGSPC